MKTDIWANGLDNPEIKPFTYGQMIPDKGACNIQWRKNGLFNKWCWKTGKQKKEVGFLIYTIHKT